MQAKNEYCGDLLELRDHTFQQEYRLLEVPEWVEKYTIHTIKKNLMTVDSWLRRFNSLFRKKHCFISG